MDNVGFGGIVAIVLYLTVTVSIGLVAARRVKTMRDFAIAGKGFGTWLVAFGVMGAVASGAAVLGHAGSGFGTGYALHIMSMGMSFLGLVLAYFVLAKPMTVISRKYEVYTLSDLLAMRYQGSKAVRCLSAIGVVLGCFIYLVVQMVAIGWVGTTIFGLSQGVSVLIGGAIVALYTVGGGIIASTWTNLFQLIVMTVFVVGVTGWMISEVGGLSGMHASLASIDPEMLQPWHSEGAFVWQNVLIYSIFVGLLAYAGVPQIAARFLTIRDSKVLRWLPLISVIMYFFATVSTWAGMGYRVQVEDHGATAPAEPDAVLPLIVMEYFPSVMVGILIAAVFAAVMSTTDSFMVVIGTATSRDILKETLGVKMSDRRELNLARISGLVLLFLAGVLALNPPEFVLGLMAVAWGALAAMLGPVLYVSVRWRRATKEGAIVALIAGIGVGGVIGFLNATVFAEDPIFAPWNVASIGVVAGLVSLIAVSLLTPYRESRLFSHFQDRAREASHEREPVERR